MSDPIAGRAAGERDDTRPASMTIQRVVEWRDVDASGIAHNALAVRLMEAAETALLERLGLVGDMSSPRRRLRIAIDFVSQLRFHDRVDIRIEATSADPTAVTFGVEVAHDGEVAIRGILVVAPGSAVDAGGPTAQAFVDRILSAGPQDPELVSR
jgi:acyl-CoA thioesterase FadM